MQDETPVATKLHVEWSDGSVWDAEGAAAVAAMRWYQSAESIMCLRSGARYTGPQIMITKPEARND